MLSRVISNLAQRHLADSKEIAMCLMADKAAGSDQAKQANSGDTILVLIDKGRSQA
jgi:hypothetical protein